MPFHTRLIGLLAICVAFTELNDYSRVDSLQCERKCFSGLQLNWMTFCNLQCRFCTLARLLTLQLCDFSWTNVLFTFGISVKWIRKCLLNVSVWLKDFLHSPQHGGFSPRWMNKCSVILHAWVNDLLHGVQHVGLDEHWARFDGVIAEKMRLFHFVEVWHLSSVCFDVISDIRGYSRGKVAFGAFLSQTAKEKMV